MNAFATALAQVVAQTEQAAKPTEQAAKPARQMRMGKNKPAKPAKPAETKPAAPAAKQVKAKPQATKPAPANRVKFYIRQGFRPTGTQLFAYTHAWLILSGLAAGGVISRAMASKIAGDTAISYHLNKTGCLELTDAGMVKVSPLGVQKFGIDRQHPEPAVIDALMAMMENGKPDGSIVKNPQVIAAV